MVIVTIEGEQETAPTLWNGSSLNDLELHFQGHDYSTSDNLKMVQHIYILTMADQSNGAIFNDLVRPLPRVTKSRHSLTLLSQKRYDIQI